jgi:hypothetical protein
MLIIMFGVRGKVAIAFLEVGRKVDMNACPMTDIHLKLRIYYILFYSLISVP